MSEKSVFHINGFLGLIVVLFMLMTGLILTAVLGSFVGGTLIIVAFLAASSLTIVAPNEAKALTFFGRYIGTIRTSGLFLTVPLTRKQTVSLRVRNFNSNLLKVNDLRGNPVEIAAVIVFKVVDTGKALFDVDDYEAFVEIQSESAIRHMASEFPYDSFNETETTTLRGNPTEVSDQLTKELQSRLDLAGVEVIETRLTHLAYATEIANAMLQRQQSAAILSARKIIVEGAVSITEDAISKLEEDTGLKLSDDRKLQLINNVLVTIISERGTQPVINTTNTN